MIAHQKRASTAEDYKSDLPQVVYTQLSKSLFSVFYCESNVEARNNDNDNKTYIIIIIIIILIIIMIMKLQ